MKVANQPQYTITKADKQQKLEIAAAWDAYKGNFKPALQVLENEPDPNVISNRCQPVVNRGVEFLFDQELEISVESDAPAGVQDLINKSWGIKETRLPLLQKLAMNGAIAGQGFLRIVPQSDGTFRLLVPDPATIYVETDTQDVETVTLYCTEYSMQKNQQTIFYREEIARIDPGDTWNIEHWTRIGAYGDWQSGGPAIPWPYTFAPIFSCQNLPMPNSFWGFPDITPDLINLNDALNLVLTDINSTNRWYGRPIVYATGTGEQLIDIKPGRIIGLPTAESKIVSVAFASDMGSSLAFSNDLRSDIDELTGVPGVATGRISALPRGSMSGIAIELLFMPLLKKMQKKRCLYGDLILQVTNAFLVLSKISAAYDISIAWQNPLPVDDLATVQAAIAKKPIGISNSTLQRELGYDPQEELALSQTEDAQAAAALAAQQAAMMPTTPAPPAAPQYLGGVPQ